MRYTSLSRPARSLPHGKGLAGGGNVMHPKNLNALGGPEQRSCERAWQAVVCNGTCKLADETLARSPQQHGTAQTMEDGQGAQESQIMGQCLAETDAGIDDQARACDAGLFAGLDADLECVVNIEHDVVVDWIALHSARIALRMHEHHRQAGRGCDLETLRVVGEGGDVIDDARTGLHGPAHHLRIARIDGQRDTGACRQTFDDGQHAPAFVFDTERLGARTGRLPTDVQEIRSLRLELKPVRDGGIDYKIATTVGETVRGDINHAHDAGLIERDPRDSRAWPMQAMQELCATSRSTVEKEFLGCNDAALNIAASPLDELRGRKQQILAASNLEGRW